MQDKIFTNVQELAIEQALNVMEARKRIMWTAIGTTRQRTAYERLKKSILRLNEVLEDVVDHPLKADAARIAKNIK